MRGTAIDCTVIHRYVSVESMMTSRARLTEDDPAQALIDRWETLFQLKGTSRARSDYHTRQRQHHLYGRSAFHQATLSEIRIT